MRHVLYPKKIKLLTVCCALGFTALGMRPASANLITNGGFETGDFTGWTQHGLLQPILNDDDSVSFGDLIQTGVRTYAPPNPEHYAYLGSPAEGNNFSFYDNLDSDLSFISQEIQTQVGQTYDLSWSLSNVLDPEALATNADNAFVVFLGEVSQPDFTWVDSGIDNPISHLFFIADTNLTNVSFGFLNNNGEFHLDNVSAAPVPEPGTWALMGITLGFLAFMQLRKKRESATSSFMV